MPGQQTGIDYSIFDPQVGVDPWLKKPALLNLLGTAAGQLESELIDTSEISPINPINPGDIEAGEFNNLAGSGKKTFSDAAAGYLMGIDKEDGEFKFIIGDATNSMDWNVTTPDTLTIKGKITASNLVLYDLVVSTDGFGDHDNLQDAIDALGASGGSIFVRSGTYTITSTITITNSNLFIIGEDKHTTIIKLANSINADVLSLTSVSDITIRSIQIDGNKANQTTAGDGIVLDDVDESIIQDCIIKDAFDDGLYIQNDSENCTFIQNEVTGCGGDGINADTVSTRNKFLQNIITSNDRGINFTDSLQNTVAHNIVRLNTGIGIRVNNAGAGFGYANIITSNQVISNGSYGIRMSGVENTVSNNSFQSNESAGLYITNDRNTIIGNNFHFQDDHGIHLTSSANDNVISGNTIQQSSSDADNTADEIFCEGTENVIIGNTIIGFTSQARYGIHVTGANNSIISNMIDDAFATARLNITDETNFVYMNNREKLDEVTKVVRVINEAPSENADPGTLADDASVGTVAWTSPSNAAASDDSDASIGGIPPGASTTSHYLKATNFGFSIPTNATIFGVEVFIEGAGTNNPQGFGHAENELKLVKGGTVSGNDNSTGTNWGSTDTIRTYGSSTDLWGISLTPSDVNATNFGCVYQGALFSPTSPPAGFVDHINMTVHYGITLNSGDVVIYAQTATTNEMKTTTTAGDDYVAGMCLEDSIDPGDEFLMMREGKTVQLKADGTTDIAVGDLLCTFTTAGIAQKAASGDMAFAIALEAYTTNDSNGVIDALLIKPRKL